MDKRMGRPPRKGGPLKVVAVLKGTEEWKAWLEELAATRGQKVANLIQTTLEASATLSGFRKPPSRT